MTPEQATEQILILNQLTELIFVMGVTFFILHLFIFLCLVHLVVNRPEKRSK